MKKQQDIDIRLKVLRQQFERMRQPILVSAVLQCQKKREEERNVQKR